MARTVDAIKKEMTDNFITNETVIALYTIDSSKTFEEQFSKVSLESVIFYIVAFCAFVLESLFDTHKKEITDLIDTKKPHRVKWYRDKALSFRYGRMLAEDSDTYDLTGIDEQSITSELVVKYASARDYQGRVFVKVAGGSDTAKAKLTPEQETALTDYFEEVKDAGVVVELINKEADHFRAEIDIYYSPLVFIETGLRITDGADVVRDAVKDFIQNKIPFNGEYQNAALIDVLQAIDGVVVPELKGSSYISDEDFIAEGDWQSISAKCTPESGYFKIYNESDLVLNFIVYQQSENE